MPMSGMRGWCAPPVVLAMQVRSLRPLLQQRLGQVVGRARPGEAAEGDHRAVRDVRPPPRRSWRKQLALLPVRCVLRGCPAAPHAKPSCADEPAGLGQGAELRPRSRPRSRRRRASARSPRGARSRPGRARPGCPWPAACPSGSWRSRRPPAEGQQRAEGLDLDRDQEAAVVVPPATAPPRSRGRSGCRRGSRPSPPARCPCSPRPRRRAAAARRRSSRFGSVVRSPSLSTTQPRGICCPRASASFTLPIATAEVAMSRQKRPRRGRTARRSPRDWCRAAPRARRRARRPWASGRKSAQAMPIMPASAAISG